MEDRTPLVYSTVRARADAERLLPGRCVENVVQAEIQAGNVTASQRGGIVFDNRGRRWVAIVKRVPARTQRGRRAWLVHEVRPY